MNRSGVAWSRVMRSRLPLAGILFAILLASCGGHPDVTVNIGGETVRMVLASTTERTGCSSEHGDAFPRDVPLTTVHAPAPVTFQIEAGQGATQIRGWIYDVDTPTTSGGPFEEFTLPGRGGAYPAWSMVPARTYSVLLNVQWSALVKQGEVTFVFRVRIEPR
jgi:hypothetical protein